MANKMVTIITPTYNRADLLPETIESVLKQDYPNIEYIILDDGSSDNTKDVVAPYLSRLKYLYHDNIGETATVNKGFELAKGDIICVINSDDPFNLENAISTAVKYLDDNPDALMAYSDWVSIDENSKVIKEERLPQYTLQNMLESASVRLGPGMFIRKTTINKIGPRDHNIKYTGDLDYSFRIISEGKIIHIPLFLATHRIHSQSLSNEGKGRLMAKEVANLGEKYIENLFLSNSKNKEKRKILSKWYFNTIFFVGNDVKGILHYLIKSIVKSPITTIKMVQRALTRKAKRLNGIRN